MASPRRGAALAGGAPVVVAIGRDDLVQTDAAITNRTNCLRLILCALLFGTANALAQTTPRHLPAGMLQSRLAVTDQFSQAAEISGVVDPGGRLVALGSSRSGIALLWHPASGRTTPLGRAGRGPGEFRAASVVGFTRDSLAVFDAIQRRLTWFRLDGRFASSAASPMLAVLAVAGDSNAVLGLPMAFFTTSGSQKATFAIERMNGRGRTPVAEAPGQSDETLSVRESGGSIIRLRNPAGAQRGWSISGDGQWICEYGPDRAAGNKGAPVHIGCRSLLDAQRSWQAPKRLMPTPISKAWADSAAAAFREGTLLPAQVADAIASALMKHGWQSPIVAIRAANDGSAWLQLADSPAGQRLARVRERGYDEWTIEIGARLLFASATHLLLGDDTEAGDTVIELWRTPR